MYFLKEIEKRLDMSVAEKEEVMRELKPHYFETMEDLIKSGVDAKEAEIEAERIMGQPEEIAQRLSATHNSASWKSALLTVVPLLGFILAILFPRFTLTLSIGNILFVLFDAIMVAGSVRELIKGRRPIWLATWLAAAIRIPISIINMLLIPASAHIDLSLAHIYWFAQLLIYCIIALVVVWRVPKLRIAAGILSVICATLFYMGYPHHSHIQVADMIAVLVINMSSPVFIMFIALGMFVYNQFGRVAQVSLFLFSMMTMYCGPSSPIYLHIISRLIMILAIIFFARASNLNRKLIIISAGLVLNQVVYSIGVITDAQRLHPTTFELIFISSIYFVFNLFLGIGIPLLIERKRRGNRLTIAS